MDIPHVFRQAASFCGLTLKYAAVCAGAAAFIVGGWMLWHDRKPVTSDIVAELLRQKSCRPYSILEMPELLFFGSFHEGEAAVDVRDWMFRSLRMHSIFEFEFSGSVEELDIHRALDAVEIETGGGKASLLAFAEGRAMVMCSFESLTDRGHFRRNGRVFIEQLDHVAGKVRRAMREVALKNSCDVRGRTLESHSWPVRNYHLQQIPEGLIQRPPFPDRR